jgi:hypothetical protein
VAVELDAAVVDLFVSLGALPSLAIEVVAVRRAAAQEKLKAVDAANRELGNRSRKLLEEVEKPI